MSSPAVAAIKFALKTDCGRAFLELWNGGEFARIRKEWPDAPEEIFAGLERPSAEVEYRQY